MRNLPLVFIDIESTGLSVQDNEIIEIGALKVEGKPPFNIIDQLNLKVLPQNIEKADKDALKIVHYSKESWQDGLGLEKALLALDEFCKNGAVMVGFNLTFDWAILDKAYHLFGRIDPFHYHRIDVLAIAYYKLFAQEKLQRFSLGELCKYFGIERETKHQALDDAKVTYLVFKKLFA